MPKAIKVQADNLWYVCMYGKDRGLNLGYIRYEYELAVEDGFEFYLITDGTPEQNNVTFTESYSSDFDVTWRFTSEQKPYEFVEIERI